MGKNEQRKKALQHSRDRKKSTKRGSINRNSMCSVKRVLLQRTEIMSPSSNPKNLGKLAKMTSRGRRKERRRLSRSN